MGGLLGSWRCGCQAVICVPHHFEGSQEVRRRLSQRKQLDDLVEGLHGEQSSRRIGLDRPQAQHSASDDPQGAFCANQQLLKIITGIILDDLG